MRTHGKESPMLRVTITKQGSPPEVREFDKTELTLGRHGKCDVVLAKHNISKIHARIRESPQGTIVVTDNQSTNGTVINGKKISGPTRLQPGDKILVGEFVIDVTSHADGSAQTGPPSTEPEPLTPLVSQSAATHATTDERDTPPDAPAMAATTIPQFDDDWDKMEPIDPAVARTTDNARPDDWDKMEPIDPAVARTTDNARPLENDWDKAEPMPGPSAGSLEPSQTPLTSPKSLEDLPTKTRLLSECLRQYVEIDEYRHVKATGVPCQCGQCLLCRSKAALGK
jgi:pSer/pThr/pTyr-binding forkhead associated (FHA) protein